MTLTGTGVNLRQLGREDWRLEGWQSSPQGEGAVHDSLRSTIYQGKEGGKGREGKREGSEEGRE